MIFANELRNEAHAAWHFLLWVPWWMWAVVVVVIALSVFIAVDSTRIPRRFR